LFLILLIDVLESLLDHLEFPNLADPYSHSHFFDLPIVRKRCNKN